MEKTTQMTRAARPLFVNYPPPPVMGKAFFVCLCLAAGLAAAGCSAQGVAAGGEAEPYSLSLVTVGPGTVSGFPKSAEAGSTVTFLPEKTRGDAETVSATCLTNGWVQLLYNCTFSSNLCAVYNFYCQIGTETRPRLSLIESCTKL